MKLDLDLNLSFSNYCETLGKSLKPPFLPEK